MMMMIIHVTKNPFYLGKNKNQTIYMVTMEQYLTYCELSHHYQQNLIFLFLFECVPQF